MSTGGGLSIGVCATLACQWEAIAAKPGNVHRGADFDDLTFADLAAAAVAIGPAMEAACTTRLGETVLAAVRATRRLVSTNANLGTILLLAPLATVPRPVPLGAGVAGVLAELDAADARLVYEAINLTEPGGMGRVGAMDIAAGPPDDLLAAMRAAADRDLVARQYVNGFAEVVNCVVPWLTEGLDADRPLGAVIVHTHVRLMAEYADSLIARKCGQQTAGESAARAAAVLDAGSPGDEQYQRTLANLDFWLRSDGHRRNPGTTADLIAAGLFAVLRDGIIDGPLQFTAEQQDPP